LRTTSFTASATDENGTSTIASTLPSDTQRCAWAAPMSALF